MLALPLKITLTLSADLNLTLCGSTSPHEVPVLLQAHVHRRRARGTP